MFKYSNYYSKTSEIVFQCFKDEPIFNDGGDVVDFAANNASFYFKFKTCETCEKCKTCENSAKGVETAVPLKYLSKFWRILKMSLINSEINLILT